MINQGLFRVAFVVQFDYSCVKSKSHQLVWKNIIKTFVLWLFFLSVVSFFRCRGPDSKHCATCKKCVGNFEHHCRWLNNCVRAASLLFAEYHSWSFSQEVCRWNNWLFAMPIPEFAVFPRTAHSYSMSQIHCFFVCDWIAFCRACFDYFIRHCCYSR